jgi:hypothetical protein
MLAVTRFASQLNGGTYPGPPGRQVRVMGSCHVTTHFEMLIRAGMNPAAWRFPMGRRSARWHDDVQPCRAAACRVIMFADQLALSLCSIVSTWLIGSVRFYFNGGQCYERS